MIRYEVLKKRLQLCMNLQLKYMQKLAKVNKLTFKIKQEMNKLKEEYK